MEFTVSKSDLVRELSLSQGVVEKKTTIPILSNVLAGGGGRPAHADGDGSGIGHPLLLPGPGEEGRLGHRSGAQAAGLRAPAARRRHQHEVPGEPLGEHHVRPVADADRGDVAGELSGTAADAGADRGDSGEDAGLDDRAHVVRDLDGGVALHAERRAAADAARGSDDGGDRWPPPGLRAGDAGGERHGGPAVPRAGSARRRWARS